MKRIIAIFISITLLCGTIFSALNLSVKSANADVTGDGYFDDLVDDLLSVASSQYSIDIQNFYNTVSPYLEDNSSNDRYWVSVIRKGNNYCMTLWKYKNGIALGLKGYSYESYGVNYSGTSYNVTGPGTTYYEFTQVANLYYVHASNYLQVAYSQYVDTAFLMGTRSWNANYGTGGQFRAFPNAYDIADSETEVYCNKDLVVAISGYGFSFSKNLYAGSYIPDPEEYNLVDFYVGTNRFLTLDNQSIIRELERADVYDAFLYFFFDEYDDSNSIAITDSDLVVVENPTLYTDQLENISPVGAYCINITDWDFDYIFFSTLVEVGDDWNLVYANCLNCPYDLVHGKIEPDERQVNIYNTFMEYYNNYNTTHVIPQQLGDYLFGISGSMLYPCNVSMPSVIAQYDSDMTVTANINTFTWSMIEPDSLAYNYELFDTVIVPASLLGSYSLVYFYDATLTTPYHFIDYEEFDSLLESFDCIIIVPDDKHTLEGHGWWNSFLPSWVTDWDNLAVSGTSSRGVEYKDSVSGNLYLGFCLVTKKAIQKQMLYNFNDGITKTYDLMVQYVETEDNWKSDFLLWSASMFTELNSVWGELDLIHKDLNNFFQSVLDKLDQLVNNTDEAIHNFWILPLFNFVKSFEPSLTGFENWIDAIEDFGDELPVLPPITVVPAIPTNFPLYS